MGFLGALGKIGTQFADAFTGGAASDIADALGLFGGSAGALGGAKANGRLTAAQLQMLHDQLASADQNAHQNALLTASSQKEQAAKDAGSLDLAQKQFSLTSPAAKLANAIRGNLAQNVQDVSVNRPAGIPRISFSGGIRPSALGPEARQAGGLMARNALTAMQTPDSFAPLPSADPTVLPQRSPSALPQPGLLEKLLNGAGLAGGIGTGVSGAMAAIQKIIGKPIALPYMNPAQPGMPSMAGTNVGQFAIPGLLPSEDDGQ